MKRYEKIAESWCERHGYDFIGIDNVLKDGKMDIQAHRGRKDCKGNLIVESLTIRYKTDKKGGKITHKTTISIPNEHLKYYEKMLGYGEKELIDNDVPRCTNIKTWTGTFDDGREIDVNLNSSDVDVWTDAVLFNGNGSEMATTEVCDSIRGKWSFEVDGEVYEAIVKGCKKKLKFPIAL